MNKAWVIIPAAGVGKRMQSDVPKQYLKLYHHTILEHTLACFIHHPEIEGVVIVLHPNDPYWPELVIKSPIPVHIVDGGQERADSVLNALVLLTDFAVSEQDFVLVHDAVRPCLSLKDLNSLLEKRSLVGDDGAILAMPVRDTMKRGVGSDRSATSPLINSSSIDFPSDHAINCTIDYTEERKNLWHALTPQMFRLGVLKQALSDAKNEGVEITDDASAIEFMGGNPALIEGSASNIKITRPADLQLADFFLNSSSLSHLDPNDEPCVDSRLENG